MELKSKAFSEGSGIPKKYSCEGVNISPPLSWRDFPPETKSFALIVDDPDSPDPKEPIRTFVHWILYNIPARVTSLEEGILNLPKGTQPGVNDWKKPAFGGPCPPIGKHRYFHKLYALDTELENLNQPTKAELESAMKGHVLAKAELIGTYIKNS